MNKMFHFDTPKESTGFLLWKVNNSWQREIKKLLSEYDLNHTQFVVLANTYYLNQVQGQVTQMDVANHVGLDKMRCSNVIKSLVSDKLLHREEHAVDTRAKIIFLSKSGLKTLKKAVKSVEAFDVIFFEKLQDAKNFNKGLLDLLAPE